MDYSEVTIVIIMETVVKRRSLTNTKIGAFAAVGVAYFLLILSSGFVTISDSNGTHHWNHMEPPHLVSAACLILCLLLGIVRKRIAHRLTSAEPLRRNHKLLTAFSTGIMAVMLFPSVFFVDSTSYFLYGTEAWSPLYLIYVLFEVAGFFLVLDFFMESNMRRRLSSSVLAKLGLLTQFIVCLAYEVIFDLLGSWSILTFIIFTLLAVGQHYMLTTAGSIGHGQDSNGSLLPMTGEDQSGYGFNSNGHGGGSSSSHGSALATLRSFFEFSNQQSDYAASEDDGEKYLPLDAMRSRRRADASVGLTGPHLIRNIYKSAADVIGEIWASSTSRKIFLFMLFNFGFMFVELAYGWWTNSLGLITDAFHMLFDCTALGIGLYAEVMSRWPARQGYSFGFGRVEVLAGYLNGVFLCFISFSIFAHSIVRIWYPPDVLTDRLLLVSCLGLGVNLIGIFAFHDFDVLELIGLKKKKEHDHDHDHEHSHDHGHGHSHGGHSHAGHSHHGHDCDHHSDNLTGIFLHILADALGSVSVIISSILIWQFGWNIVDPICSLLSSILIFASVVPLLKSSVTVLMQTAPSRVSNKINSLMDRVHATPGVLLCSSRHFWALTSDHIVGSMNLQITPEADPYTILSAVQQECRKVGAKDMTIQLTADAHPRS